MFAIGQTKSNVACGKPVLQSRQNNFVLFGILAVASAVTAFAQTQFLVNALHVYIKSFRQIANRSAVPFAVRSSVKNYFHDALLHASGIRRLLLNHSVSLSNV